MSTPPPERIKLCWRASFQFPKGKLNPLGCRMLALIDVEIRETGGGWKAYRPGTRDEFPIASQQRASTLKRQISDVLFRKQAGPWVALEVVGSNVYRELKTEEFYLDAQERAWRKT